MNEEIAWVKYHSRRPCESTLGVHKLNNIDDRVEYHLNSVVGRLFSSVHQISA